MRRLSTKTVAIAAVAALALTGCGRADDTGSGSSASGGGEKFAKDSLDRRLAAAEDLGELGPGREPVQRRTWPAPASRPTCSSPTAVSPSSRTRSSPWSPRAPRSSSSAPSTARSWAPSSRPAKDSGAIVIAYDRLLKNTDAVDYYVAYDNFKVGVLQGKALLEGMAKKKPTGPYNIELFAGSPDDANAQVFFDGAMSVLKPKIDDGTLKVAVRPDRTSTRSSPRAGRPRTRRSAWTRCSPAATPSATLDGVLSPERHPGPRDPDLGQGRRQADSRSSPARTPRSSRSSRSWRASSTPRSTRTPATSSRHTIEMVQAIQKGKEPKINDTKSVQQRRQGRPGLPARRRSSSPRRTPRRRTPTTRPCPSSPAEPRHLGNTRRARSPHGGRARPRVREAATRHTSRVVRDGAAPSRRRRGAGRRRGTPGPTRADRRGRPARGAPRGGGGPRSPPRG